MVTYSSFVALYPEFTPAPVATVNASIAEALIMVDPAVYRAKTDAAVAAFAAHLIALNPLGEYAKLSKTAGSEDTIYLKRFQRIQRSCTSGFRVI